MAFGSLLVHLRSRRGLRVAAAAALAAFAAALSARADQLTLRASHDATLYEDNPAFGNGGGGHFFTGMNGHAARRRALVAFDVAGALPSGTMITAATLRLYLSRTHGGVSNVSLHTLLASWGEGATRPPGNEGAGDLATDGDTTWSHRVWSTTRWKTAGGDFTATASASSSVDATGSYYEWTSAQMASDAQAWLTDASKNYGWILVGEEGDAPSKRFDGRIDKSRPPELLLSYTPPASPSGACCAPDGSCGIVLDPGTSCGGVYQGAATTCDPSPCPPPTGACCLPDALATCQTVTEASCTGSWQGAGTTCTSQPCPVVLPPFVDELPVPPVATPLHTDAGSEAHYRLAMVETRQKLHRDLPPTTVWGFDDGTTGPLYPGPTLEATAGKPVHVTWANDLRDASGAPRKAHYLAVDHCLHGASTDEPRTVVHLHGGHVPAAFDGYPELTLLPGQETTYDYPNQQDAATLWYHDHSLGITRLNVYMGLAGFYLIRSDEERALGLPSGKHDVPLVIQDRSFYPDGRLRYPAEWMEHFFGDTVLVNGKVWPYFRVDRGKYRFRVLNGSGSRTYTLQLSSGDSFQLIGSDGGLLAAPYDEYSVTLAPGERMELLLDFSAHAEGDELVLQNTAPAPFPTGDEKNAITNVMKFVVTKDAGETAKTPEVLRTIAPIDPTSAETTRDFTLQRQPDSCGGAAWRINGMHWDDVMEKPHLGATEVWRFINRSGVTHPMHVHLVMFQVLDRQLFRLDGDQVVPQGEPFAPAPEESGWKDTVRVGPLQIVRVVARFEDFAGRFVYHCHVLEHEDNDMMRQFEVVNDCGDHAVAIGLEECDDGNQTSGDGCSADCRLEPAVDAGVDAGVDGGVDAGPDGAAKDASSPVPDGAPSVRPASGARGGCTCGIAARRRFSFLDGAAVLLAPLLLARRRVSRKPSVRSRPRGLPSGPPTAPLPRARGRRRAR